LYRNSPLQALRFYRRALAIDGGDGIAADRYAFVAMTVRRPAVVRDAIAVASGYLRRNAADVTVRMDRAMCYRAIGDAGNALADFDTVAKATRDIRALAFAGYAARALGRPQQARRFWQAALAIQPRFPAALDGLSRMEQTR
jgi:tetratricopeptide (TPR) repeat protein